MENPDNNKTKPNTHDMEEDLMGIKEYADIMRFVFKSQIELAKEELENPRLDYEKENYLSGVITGLQIALEKIDASMFLAEGR